MIFKNIIPLVIALSFLTSTGLATQEKLTRKQLDKINSIPELKNILEKRLPIVDALTKKGNWTIKEISGEIDLIEMIANRIHYLSHPRENEINPLTQPLFKMVVRLFNTIHQIAVKEMETLEVGTMDDEKAMEHLFASERWKELEITASMVSYRLNKAKYYWALTCPDNSPDKKKLLKEALDSLLISYNVVYQNPQLTAFSLFIRALCLRELGNLQEAIKELNYIIHKVDESFLAAFLRKVHYELARTYLLADDYHECLEEIGTLLADSAGIKDDPELINAIKLLKIKTSFMFLITKGNELDHRQIEKIYSEAILAVKELTKASNYWQDQVFSVFIKDSVKNYIIQEGKDDPYLGWILGEGLLSERRYEEAIPLFKKAFIGIDPEMRTGRSEISFKLGVCYYNLKQFKEAIPYFASCIDQFPQSEIAEKVTYLHYKAYEHLYGEVWKPPYIKAIKYYLKKFPHHPFAADAHYRLGKYYGEGGNRAAAIKELEQVKKGSKYFLQAKFFGLKYRVEEFEGLRYTAGVDVQKSYRNAINARNNLMASIREKNQNKHNRQDANGDNILAYTVLLSARLFVHGPEKKYQQAIQELKNFEQLYPHQKELFLPVRIVRIEAFQKLLDFKSAKKEIDKTIQNYHTHPEANKILDLLAEQFTEKGTNTEDAAVGRNEIAILIYENLLAKTREPSLKEKIQYSLASLYLKLGNDYKAEITYQEIIGKNPESTQALNGLGKIYERKKKFKRALEYWRLLEENLSVGDPGWYNAKYKIASAHDRLGNSQQACKILSATRILHPDLGGEDTKGKFLQLEKKVCSQKPQ